MKLRRLKTVTVVIAAFILTASTAGGASGTDLATVATTGNMSSVEQNAITPLGKVEDEKFIFTLEQAVTWSDRIGFVYSVEGKTETANAELADENYENYMKFQYTVKLPAGSEIQYDYWRSGEMKDFRTETKRYFFGIVEMEANPQGSPISIGLNAMTGDETYIRTPVNEERTAFAVENAVASGKDGLYITVPMDHVVKELVLIPPTLSGNGPVVKLSPLDISVERVPLDENGYVLDTGVSFRMEDGSLKTLAEFYLIDNLSYGFTTHTYRGVARHVVDLSKFKSIIVDGQEYEIVVLVKP